MAQCGGSTSDKEKGFGCMEGKATIMLPFFPKGISSGRSTRGKLKRGRLSICHNRGWVFYEGGGGKGGEVINLSSAPEEEKHGRKEEQESRKERPFLV